MKKVQSEPRINRTLSTSSRARDSFTNQLNTTLRAVSIMAPTQLLHIGLEIPPASSFPSESVKKKGYLMKQETRRPLTKMWQKRFCVLAKNKIFVYKNERSTGVEKSSVMIDLSEYSRCQRNNNETKSNTNFNEFVIYPTKKKIFGTGSITLASEDLIEVEDWIIQIQKVIYNLTCHQDISSDKKEEKMSAEKVSNDNSRLVDLSDLNLPTQETVVHLRRPPPASTMTNESFSEGSLCNTGGRLLKKGFESYVEKPYSHTKSQDLTYAYSSSSSNDDGDSLDDSFISPSMVNEIRATPKSVRSFGGVPAIPSDSPICTRAQHLGHRTNRLWSPIRVVPSQIQKTEPTELEDDQFVQTLPEDDTSNESHDQSPFNGSYNAKSEKFRKSLLRANQKAPVLISCEENVEQLTKDIAQLKMISQRLEVDLRGAKNDVGNVQESLAAVQSSAETIAEKVERFSIQMKQIERQASSLINELKSKSEEVDQKLLTLQTIIAQTESNNGGGTSVGSSDCNANKFPNFPTFGTNPNWPCFKFGETVATTCTSSSGSQTFPKNKHIYSNPSARKSDPTVTSGFVFNPSDQNQARKNASRHSVQICLDPDHSNFELKHSHSHHTFSDSSKPRFAINPSNVAQVVSVQQCQPTIAKIKQTNSSKISDL